MDQPSHLVDVEGSKPITDFAELEALRRGAELAGVKLEPYASPLELAATEPPPPPPRGSWAAAAGHHAGTIALIESALERAEKGAGHVSQAFALELRQIIGEGRT